MMRKCFPVIYIARYVYKSLAGKGSLNFKKLKADRPHPCDYSTHRKKHLGLIMTIILSNIESVLGNS